MNIEELEEHGRICWATAIVLLAEYLQKKTIPSKRISEAEDILHRCLTFPDRNLIFEGLSSEFNIEKEKIRRLHKSGTFYRRTPELERTKSKVSPIEMKEIKKLLDKGFSSAEVGGKLGMSSSTVRSIKFRNPDVFKSSAPKRTR